MKEQPDPIQAAAMEVCEKLYGPVWARDKGDIIATSMRKLVAREQLKDIHAVAALREELAAAEAERSGLRSQVALHVKEYAELQAELARLRERVAELETANVKAEVSVALARTVQADLNKCHAQLAAARRDAERLDWLKPRGFPITYEDAPRGVAWNIESKGGHGDLRAAIDAAMQREDGK